MAAWRIVTVPWLYRLCLAITLIQWPLLARALVWEVTPAGAASDALTGFVLYLLLAECRPALLLPMLLAWTIGLCATLELVEAVGRMPDLADLAFLADPDFLQHSAGEGQLAHPYFLAGALLFALFTTGLGFLLRRQGHHSSDFLLRPDRWPHQHPHVATAVAIGLLLITHQMAVRADETREPWKQYNLIHKLVAEQLSDWQFTLASRDALDWANANMGQLNTLDLQGTPLLPLPGKARNVLVIALEGIPGAYLDPVREQLGYRWPASPMPQLSRFAREQQAMHTPDYIVHHHQTIRGLYTLLCGDYDKLDGSTPKGVEMLSLPQQTRHTQCLPAQLQQHGYNTHFLQAADLVFMAKDKIMPHIGFGTVCGPSCIKRKARLPFAWGLDDRTFLEGSADYIAKLNRQPQPWMLTLLTVGTHQPYSAPPSYLSRYPDEKMASVAYLDDAVTGLLTQLQKNGTLNNTLVIVTSDESQGIDDLRLASAWGLNLVFAPERASLPRFHSGVYGNIDVTASVLDYLGLPPAAVIGRSLFRHYNTPREILSYTSGLLYYLNGQGELLACDFQHTCQSYRQTGFLVPTAQPSHRFGGQQAARVMARAQHLDHSLTTLPGLGEFLFADQETRKLKAQANNDWTDNLIGAQYLDFPAGTEAEITIRIKAIKTDKSGARLRLAIKEKDRDSLVTAPAFPLLHSGEDTTLHFTIANPQARHNFSFHLLGEGKGEILIEEFRVTVMPAREN